MHRSPSADADEVNRFGTPLGDGLGDDARPTAPPGTLRSCRRSQPLCAGWRRTWREGVGCCLGRPACFVAHVG